MTVEKIKQQIKDIDQKIDAILNSDGALTAEQKAELDKLETERTGLEAKLDLLEKQEARQQAQKAKEKADADAAEKARLEAKRKERTAPSGRLTQADLPNTGLTIPAEPRDHAAESQMGFHTFGDFATEVRKSGMLKAATPRLVSTYDNPAYAAVMGMNEGIASEGGALSPPAFSQKIMQRVYGEMSLLSRCDTYTIPGDSMTWPRNTEDSRASGSRHGGVRSYWRGEGMAPDRTTPNKFGTFKLSLHKLIALAGVTDELIKDVNGPVLEQYLYNALSDEMGFEVNAAIIAGTGSGQPSGIKNADCAVSVSKEAGQAARTVNAKNVVNMWSRLWAGCRQNAVWLINQDIEPELMLMSYGLGTAGVMLYMPPGGLSASPYATLMGRPVIPIEQCETLGTKGDIILTDLRHYVAASNGGPVTATSMHLWFDTDQMAFRVTFRIDGAPWWAKPLTPFKGTLTQSCIVTLATRA